MKKANEQAVIQLKKLGYDIAAIRRALLKLTGTTEPELAHNCGVTRAAVAAQIGGLRKNLRVQALIAGELEVRPEILFDDWDQLREQTGAVLRPVNDGRCL